MSLPRLRILYRYHHFDLLTSKYVAEMVDVEVLSLHLNKGTMRVRALEKISFTPDGPSKVRTWDTDIGPFINQYEIAKRKSQP